SRVYTVKAYEIEDVNGNGDNGDTDGEERVRKLNYVTTYKDKIYLASDRGVLVSEAGQENWEAVTQEGLLTRNIRSVLPMSNGLLAASDKGIFSYKKEENRWSSISSGLTTLKVNEIAGSKDDRLFAATEKGIYTVASDNDVFAKNNKPQKQNLEIFDKEPSILEIQQAAIQYAEVSPEKIKWMRSAAMNKAWLPDVSFGLDGDVNRTIDLDRGSTTTPDFYIEGPGDKGWGWDIDLSWDLSELIWDDAQANIDVRSRLMVQLRNDVLDEITKLYFERRRLQLELAANSPKDEKDMTLKELRLAELTANIDALTGGYLTERLQDF
ncbi:MAG: hypothetical protein HQ572_00920, partial [Candidatus Omnitrophica bacterium]|nr:hypothetical protein [Candidatus Omnitrophota bacterium]